MVVQIMWTHKNWEASEVVRQLRTQIMKVCKRTKIQEGSWSHSYNVRKNQGSQTVDTKGWSMNMTNWRQVQRHHQIMIMIWLCLWTMFLLGTLKVLSTVSVSALATFNSLCWKHFNFQQFTLNFKQFLFKVFQLSTQALHMIRRDILATPASRMVGVRENNFPGCCWYLSWSGNCFTLNWTAFGEVGNFGTPNTLRVGWIDQDLAVGCSFKVGDKTVFPRRSILETTTSDAQRSEAH
jgi:hypothetical protein